MDGGGVVQTVTGNPGAQLSIPVPSPKLWSPDNPFLYGLSIALTRNGNVVDSVGSYFGMRKISIGTVDGHLKMLLNNAFTFEIGPLDQGYWPDGNYTAPTDEALKSDLETAKAFGFNMVRKHVKVEPYRWYYWADMLGLLVWQDMPSAITYGSSLPPDTAEFLSELTRMVQTHWNSPSIIMWVVFNEGCGQHNTQSLVAAVKGLDPSRLADEASGSTLYGYGDVRDVHSYPRPACPTSATEALACGEYGGLGYLIAGHSWDPNNPYVPKVVADAAAHNSLYNDYMNYLAYLKTNNGLSAAVYTQLTDVENEYDGLMTYDRAVFRGDTALLRGCAEKLGKTLSLVEILPMSQTQAQTWRYTTAAPDSTWITPSFNDAAWSSGQAGFGTIGGARTTWNSADIWLRRHFNPGAVSSSDRADLMLNIFHDEGSEVYLNGVPACTTTGYTTTYALELVSLAAKNALIANADNCIAVHCHQTAGGQFIDVGMQRMDYSDGSTATANGRLTHASSGGEGRISFIGVPGGLRVACGTSSEGGVLKVVVCNPSGQLVWRSEKHTLEGHDCTICTVDRLSHGFYLVKAIRTGPHGEVLSAHAGTLVVPGNR
jgi:hypothetical protein